ncbi:MAG: alpha/beta hydrolase [Candidatus Hodarchaeota archaeon]
MNKSINELESLKHLANPFFFEGIDDIGVLLVHGFTASPTEMLPLGKFLYKQGYTVHGVRLAGHGTDYRELPKFTWKDWYQSVEDGYNQIKDYCNSVVPIGISMGALLCLYLVHNHPEIKFPKLVLLSPPFGLKSRMANLTPLLRFFLKFTYKGEETLHYFLKHNLYSYMYRPISSVAQLIRFQRHLNKQNINLTNPTLISYGSLDHMISIPAIYRILKRNFSVTSLVELLELPNSGHILTVEPDSEKLFKKIATFLEKE